MSFSGEVDIPSTYTIKVGGTGGNTVHVDSDLDNIHVKEIPRIEFGVKEIPRIEFGVKEIPRIELAVTEIPKIEVDTNSTINVAVKEIPDTRVHVPAHYNLGFSLFGLEVWKLSLCGESQVINEKYKPRQTEMCG
ncbi:MAG: hypothetical protein ACE5FU_05700 [Nitrospinota bacterium]